MIEIDGLSGEGRLPPSKTKRGIPRCDLCALLEPECICASLPRLSLKTQVVVVMHHTELRRSSNTGRLALRTLVGARALIRGAREAAPRAVLPSGQRMVLFPSDRATLLERPPAANQEPTVLLVPDGNWRQAFHAVRRDPDLAGIPHVMLPPGPPSRYALRKTKDSRVCTLEAIARALGILEGPEAQLALENVLDRFVESSLRSKRRGQKPDFL